MNPNELVKGVLEGGQAKHFIKGLSEPGPIIKAMGFYQDGHTYYTTFSNGNTWLIVRRVIVLDTYGRPKWDIAVKFTNHDRNRPNIWLGNTTSHRIVDKVKAITKVLINLGHETDFDQTERILRKAFEQA